jgi:large subunit ribosomal protein L28
MPRICYLSGRKTAAGNNRSHSMRATKRTYKVNIQNKKMSFGGLGLVLKISTRMYKKLKGFI